MGRFYYNGHNLEKKEISYHDTCSGVEVIHRLSYKYLVERELLITNMQRQLFIKYGRFPMPIKTSNIKQNERSSLSLI